MKISLEKPRCNSIGHIRFEYNRNLDKIFLVPCCSLNPKKYEEPFAFDRKYFLNNIEECINKYSKYNLRNLKQFYDGRCEIVYPVEPICYNYTYNKFKLKQVDLAISKWCNLNCIMCPYDHKKLDIESELYIELLKYFETIDLDYFNFTSVGEPLLYKQETFNFIKKSKCNNIELVTNGLLFNEDDIKFLKQFNNKLKITVSIDDIYEHYEKIRLGSSFDKVMSNVLLLKESGLLNKIYCVIQKENVERQEIILNFFNKLNLDIRFIIDFRISDDLLKFKNLYFID